jgi:itaconyl-CoA hydratase
MERVGYCRISENRYREQRGLFFEDFSQGLVIEHQSGRTITVTDSMWQSLLWMNPHPLHLDEQFADASEYGGLIVPNLVTLCIVDGLTAFSITQNASTCLRWDSVQPSTPVFIGDTLYAESKVLDVRDCLTRENHGTVVVHSAGRNQHGMSVIEFIRTIIVKRRGAAVPYEEATDRPGHREFS